MVKITIGGTKRAAQVLKVYEREVGKNMEKANRAAAVIVEKTWKGYLSGTGTPTRLGKRTGTLARSIRTQRRGPVGYAVGTSLAYARIHEFGGKTKPHVIVPKIAQALRFQIGGRFVFAKSVRHPGSKMPERPHMRVAIRLATPAVIKVYEGRLKEAQTIAENIARTVRSAA